MREIQALFIFSWRELGRDRPAPSAVWLGRHVLSIECAPGTTAGHSEVAPTLGRCCPGHSLPFAATAWGRRNGDWARTPAVVFFLKHWAPESQHLLQDLPSCPHCNLIIWNISHFFCSCWELWTAAGTREVLWPLLNEKTFVKGNVAFGFVTSGVAAHGEF